VRAHLSIAGAALAIALLAGGSAAVADAPLELVATPPAALTLEQLRESEYWLPIARDRRESFTLVEGAARLSGAIGRVQLIMNDVAFGDLNGDARPDAVAVLSLEPGGSTRLLYAVVLLNDDGVPREVAVELLGDRVKVGRLYIANGAATVIYLTQRPTDAMCCPTRWASTMLRAPALAVPIGPTGHPPPASPGPLLTS
jgi:hypothetical protein